MAVELVSAYISLIPSMKGAAKQITSQLGGVNVAPIGSKFGTQISKGIGQSLKATVNAAIIAPAAAALDKQAGATRDLGAAERELSKARAGQQTAQAKVTSAEEKLAKLRDSGKATAGQLETAEAELNTAKVALAETNIKVGTAEDSLTKAKSAATSANQAYIDSLKQTSTVSGKLQTALPVIGARMQEVGTQWKNAGKNISDVGSSISKKLTAPVAAATGAAAGLVGVLGFKRLVGIDTARGQFKGLGYDADAVMQQVDKGVTGTALSMADGASMAVGILATGAVPMEQLESQIQRTANVAAAYGVESAHAGNLLNAVLTKNKVTYGDLSQMQANGIPIISQLAKHYGVAGDEIEKMASDGKISIEDMNQVLDNNAGAAAEEYGKTWAGVTANIKSNIGRIGADVLGNIFPQLKAQAESFLVTLKSPEVKAFAQELGVSLGDAFAKVTSAIGEAVKWFTSLSPAMQKVILGVGVFAVTLGPTLIVVGKLATGIGAIISVGGSMVSLISKTIPVFKALNVVMRANPIGLVVTAIAALVAGLVWFFTQTEIGKEIWGGFVNFLKASAEAIGAFFASWGASVSEAWNQIWSGFSSIVTGVWNAITTFVSGALAALKAVVMTVGASISAAWSATWNGIKAFFSAIWAGIVLVVTTYIKTVLTVITAVVNTIRTVWANVWNGIKTLFGNVWNWIVSTAKTLVNNLRTGITAGVNAVRTAWSAGWNAIKTAFSNVWNWIVSAAKGFVANLRNGIQGGINAVRNVWNSVWSGIKSFFATIWGGIVSAASSFMGSVKSTFNNALSFIRGIPNSVVGYFSGLGSKLLASGKSLISGFVNGIKKGFSNAIGAVKDGLSNIRNFFPFSPAKEGPFSGRGWVAYSGLSLGETFSESVADSLHDGTKGIVDELDNLENEFNRDAEAGFRVSSAVPDSAAAQAAGRGGFGANGALAIHVENMTVDSDDRVKELGQELWTRANRADRSQGKVSIGGVVE